MKIQKAKSINQARIQISDRAFANKIKKKVHKKKSALVYCEGQFGQMDGKTAAALVRHSEIYSVVGVIDSSLTGKDAGEELGGKKSGIPIFKNLAAALRELPEVPDCYIYGKAPLATNLSSEERLLILEAMENKMDIINGLHQFFTEDKEFALKAVQHNIQIQDIRKAPPLKDLHVYTGQISRVDVPVIAILGTDCACGKMTTAVELNNAFNELGIHSVLVATGQTSLMQGARYGISIDALVSQFVVGEIENAVIQAFDKENPQIILVEGQSAVSHPAFMGSLSILKGSQPDGVILQHPPARRFRCDFPHLVMPTIESEIKLIESMAKTKVLAVTLSHEDLTENETCNFLKNYETHLQLPVTDVLSHGCKKLIKALQDYFPQLNTLSKRQNLELVHDMTMKQAQSF